MIIALESASPDQSVAVADPDGSVRAEAAWSAGHGQGSHLLPRLEAVLASQGAAFGDVTGVAVGVGPGSFTGLRVGLALAKGLAAGLAVPIVGIGSLDAWLAAEPDATGALVQAGAAEVWASARDDTEPRLVPVDAISPIGRSAPLVAPGALAAELGLLRSRPPDRAAAAVARLAAARIRAGTADDLAMLEPVYLRPPRGLADAPLAPITWL